MRVLARTSTLHKLDEVNWYLHDVVFEKDAVDWDPETGIVRIPFEREAGQQETTYGLVVVEGVDNMTIDDPVDVGWYDINNLEYDETNSEVVINGNTPIGIRLRVRNGKSEISVLENVAGVER